MKKKLTIGLMIIFLSMTILPGASTSSAEGARVVGPNGHLYQVIETFSAWHEARDYCPTLGAHLVTISSLEENQFVSDLLSWGWLGATDEATEGVWVWVTGEPWTFTNWAPGEPNNCCPPEYCGGTGCTPEHYLTFWGDPYVYQWNDVPSGAQYFVCEWDVLIDIKPGSFPNSINLDSNGVVSVAVLTTPGFDAGTVDPVTVQFADAYPLRWASEDVDCDGDLDMLFKFATQSLNLDLDSTQATLSGNTFAGVPFQAADSVKIVP